MSTLTLYIYCSHIKNKVLKTSVPKLISNPMATTLKYNIDNKIGRGLIIYTKADIDISQITRVSEFSEHLIIKIPLRRKDKLTTVGLYKSPGTSGENEVAIHNVLRKF